MDIAPKQNYPADLAEKCRKALEVNFGEIPMPKGQTKRRVVSKKKVVSKRNPSRPIFF